MPGDGGPGRRLDAIIELNTHVDEHAWVFANNKLIARGEIVVTGDSVGIEITDT